MVFRVLGPLEVWANQLKLRISRPRQERLLARLLLDVNRSVAVSDLVDAIWNESPPDTAVRQVRNTVSQLRRLWQLPEAKVRAQIVTEATAYRLETELDNIDLFLFRQQLARARALLEAGSIGAARERLQDALRLWRGHAFAGIDSEAIQTRATALNEEHILAWEEYFDLDLQLGRHHMVLVELPPLAVEYPFREKLVRQRMLALYRCGRQAEALNEYQRFRQILANELGSDPARETETIYIQVLHRDPLLLEASPLAALDLSSDSSIRAIKPAQLPPQVGHFVGRGREIETLNVTGHELPDGQKIILIAGPAGIGKTALAVHWAHTAKLAFPDGQIYLDLRGHDRKSALRSGEIVPYLLRSLSVDPRHVPHSQAEQLALYRSILHDKRLLIIFDNARTASQVRDVIPPTQLSLAIITSRYRMHALAAEPQTVTIPLSPFQPEESVQLLQRIAGQLRIERESQYAQQLVALCGHLPLAIRLIAGKLVSEPHRSLKSLVSDLTVNQSDVTALRLDEDSPTIQAAFDSTYRDLRGQSRHVFRRLGLHPGRTFHVSLAAALGGTSLDETYTCISELTEANLVEFVDEDRYKFYDLIHVYARTRAVAEEPRATVEQTLDALVSWYVELAYTANRVLRPELDLIQPTVRQFESVLPKFEAETEALKFMDLERPNLSVVAEMASTTHRDTAMWQMVTLSYSYHFNRGFGPREYELGRLALTSAHRASSTIGEAEATIFLSNACGYMRRFDEALDYTYRAADLFKSIGETGERASAYVNAAIILTRLRRFDEVRPTYELALNIAAEASHVTGHALNNLGAFLREQGDYEDSLLCFKHAIDILGRSGNDRRRAVLLGNMGATYAYMGDHDSAVSFLTRCVTTLNKLGQQVAEAIFVEYLGYTFKRANEPITALEWYGRALTLHNQTNDLHRKATVLNLIGEIHLRIGDRKAARNHFEEALRIRKMIPDPDEETRIAHNLSRAVG